MARHLLTDKQCATAKSGEKSIRKMTDGEGLYLWVYANGTKYWRFRYWQRGKEKSLSLGVYPKVSLAKARESCERERQRLAANLDPSVERKTEKLLAQVSADNTFKAIALEWWSKKNKSQRYLDDIKRRQEMNVFPFIGGRPIALISRAELSATLQKIEDRGSYDQARRVLREVRQIFDYAVDKGFREANPALRLEKTLTPHTKKNQPAIEQEEIPALMRAIAGYEKIGDRQTMLGLLLLAYTFVRTQELISATWSEFDLDAGGWEIPKARMKMRRDHFVPLASQSIEIFRELKEMGAGSKFVFPGRNRDKPMSNNTLLFALYRLGYKSKMTGHGFRAVASTVLNGMGFKPDAVERQLAHEEENETKAAYDRQQYIPDRMRMMQTWADYLSAFTKSAEVIPIDAQLKQA
ncbi:MAG: integrase arm-type DNA-binding domain-containing protein [Burkholderiales bacterium]